ncbi:phosphate/phosphite/phosphonate ABC transporter substrate-binding protein [Pseudomonas sp. SC11]|uniref:phosphate/phosphite/phosphonate ABC transporter substrate-binding protein n=1 Tax=Pseudomonas sp. SC11 TaxID=326927 RepID=UPI00399A6D89
MRILKAFTLLALLLLPVTLLADCAERTLRLAVIPMYSADLMLEQHQPLLQHLSEVTGLPVELVVASSYEAVVDAIVSGGADLARLGPAAYVLAHRRDPRVEAFATFALNAGAYTAAGSQYQSLLLTRADGPAQFAQLRGKRVALSDPASTSGSLVPSVEFAGRVNTPLRDYFGALVYAGTHDKALDALLEGRVDAAFVASERADAYLARHALEPEAFQVLWRSAPIPYDPYVLSAHLCPALKARIRQAMLADPQALAAFVRSQDASALVVIGPGAYTGLEQVMEQALKAR